MLEVHRKQFEGVIHQILRTTDKNKLIAEFSNNLTFYCSILNDISKAKDSPNYHVLQRLTRNNKIVQQFVVKQASYIVCCLCADKAQQDYHDIGDEHGGKSGCLSPVVIKEPRWVGVNSRKLMYSFSLAIFMLVLVLCVIRSGLLFDSTEGKKGSQSTGSIAQGQSNRVIQPRETTEEGLEGTQMNKPELRGGQAILLEQEHSRGVSELRGGHEEWEEGSKYVVKQGDNLWEIARRFNTSVKALRDVNGLNSNRLDVGDELIIPSTRQKEVMNKELAAQGAKQTKQAKPKQKHPHRLE